MCDWLAFIKGTILFVVVVVALGYCCYLKAATPLWFIVAPLAPPAGVLSLPFEPFGEAAVVIECC